jgi:hypothetical protein
MCWLKYLSWPAFFEPDPRVAALWLFLPAGYLLSVLVETPVLLAGLSDRHPMSARVFAGLWLTACSYPVVILVLPVVMGFPQSRLLYLAVAEPLAVLGECLLFWLAFGRRPGAPRKSLGQDFVAITLANVASMLAGEVLFLAAG